MRSFVTVSFCYNANFRKFCKFVFFSIFPSANFSQLSLERQQTLAQTCTQRRNLTKDTLALHTVLNQATTAQQISHKQSLFSQRPSRFHITITQLKYCIPYIGFQQPFQLSAKQISNYLQEHELHAD